MSFYRLFATWGVLITLLTTGFAHPVLANTAAASSTGAAAPQTGLLERISAGSNGAGGGTYASLSANGRFVAFESTAADLAPGHLSDSWDTYLRDRQAGTNLRVSVKSDGSPVYNVGDYTAPPRTAGDGRYVVFISRAEDLVGNDANGMPDVFIRDRQTGQTQLVSVGMDGKSGNADSYNPNLTPDGRYVVFESYASNLVPDDTNNSVDIFLRDRTTNVTERISVNTAGQQGSDWHDIGGFSNVSISDDGRYVAFSFASLPGFTSSGVFLRDRVAKTTTLIADGGYPAISGNGRFIAFVTSAPLVPADTNAEPDVYVYDRTTGAFELVSVSSSGGLAHGQIISTAPDISADGSKVVFESNAPDLVSGDTNNASDIFLRDRNAKTTTLVSQPNTGGSANGESHNPSISADGSTIAFMSLASNLVAGDTNGVSDVFVYTRPAQSFSLGVKLFLTGVFR